MKIFRFAMPLAAVCAAVAAYAATSAISLAATPAVPAVAPDLDLTVAYYSKTVTPDGVTRESRYEEKMLRRPGHVWSARVLPARAAPQEGHHHGFNHIVLPRHVTMAGKTPRVEYVDAKERAVIAIPPSEFENVNFDGSWDRAFYLLDPRLLGTMPVTARASSVAGARWREREEGGVYQRVLWDEQRQIPLVIESGDKAGTFYRRMDVTAQAGVAEAPWKKLQGYAQREYSDFHD
jgi:hypothetical protein